MQAFHRLAAARCGVGFIGIGNMGAPMALRLAQHECRVRVFDSDPSGRRSKWLKDQHENIAVASSLGGDFVVLGPVGERDAPPAKRRIPRPGPGDSLRTRSRQRLCNASMSAGITLWTSPTIPRSATAKIGASGSLLMAMMFFDPFIPTRCWVAPEMPHAT